MSLETAAKIVAAIQNAGNEQKSLPELRGRRVRTQTFYVANAASTLAANSNETLPANLQNNPGYTNFPTGAQLDKGQYFLCTEIRVLFDTTTNDPTAALWANVAPVNFKNGELTIGQVGQPTLFTSSGTDVTNFKASTGNDDDFRAVESPFLWQPQKKLSSVLAPVGTLPATCSYKIEFRGFMIFEA